MNRECAYPDPLSSDLGRSKPVRNQHTYIREVRSQKLTDSQRNKDRSGGAPRKSPLSRAGSVASFSSASSHGIGGSRPLGSRRNSWDLDGQYLPSPDDLRPPLEFAGAPGDFGSFPAYEEPLNVSGPSSARADPLRDFGWFSKFRDLSSPADDDLYWPIPLPDSPPPSRPSRPLPLRPTSTDDSGRDAG